MIFPVPWHLGKDDPAEAASAIPASAIDVTSYPPYRLVWLLEWYDRKTECIAGELILSGINASILRKIFRRPPSDPMIAGVYPITARYREKIERLLGRRLHFSRYSYFIGAIALNHGETGKPRDD